MIEVSHLTKMYGNHTAVSNLNFQIESGHIYGFLGPNGAGKSTTMNIMTGCLAATSGEVRIDGYDIFEQPKEAKKRIGYLPEIPPLYTEQTVWEYLYFVAEAKGLKREQLKDEIRRVMEEAHIEDVQQKIILHLSKGYRQRVGIAQALLGNPEVIILDEPTVGLDPAQIIEIRDLIHELGQKHTVILSSHILSEIQAVCDRVLIISKGELVAFDTPENLSRKMSAKSRIDLCSDAPEEVVRKILDDTTMANAYVIRSSEIPRTVCAEISVGEADPAVVCRELFLAFSNHGAVLLQLTPVKIQLEDIFLELTGQDPAAAAVEEKEAVDQ